MMTYFGRNVPLAGLGERINQSWSLLLTRLVNFRSLIREGSLFSYVNLMETSFEIVVLVQATCGQNMW